MSATFNFVLPGLNNSGPLHWQSRWERLYGFTRIHQRDWDTPDKNDWIYTINEVIAPFPPEKVILIAHSLACAAVAHWASRYAKPIRAALLVAPADTDAPSFPQDPTGFDPMPLQSLPFKTIVVTSTNDEYVTPERAEYFATQWRSTFVNIGNKGHINAASGLGDWPEGYKLLQTL